MLRRLFSTSQETHHLSSPGLGSTLSLSRQKTNKTVPVHVVTMDAVLEFNIDVKCTGKDLFDLVCRTIGLREVWYFGLQYIDVKGYTAWLKENKEVVKHKIVNTELISLKFLAKFYPEEITMLLQEVTQHLFFLQVRQYILDMDIYCPPAAAVLLASYAMQAKYGDIDDTNLTSDMFAMEELLPQRVIDQYNMTPDMWADKVKTWHGDHKGLSRYDAELEYLKIVQDLEMYGVNYFSIHNKKMSALWLGIDALGLMIYARDNRMTPKLQFPWNEIKNITARGRKFTIKCTYDTSTDFVFVAQKNDNSKLILELCVGNHKLYQERRKPDTIEMQQMRYQADEEKERREMEKQRLMKEKQQREKLEREREEANKLIAQLQEDLHRSEETAELLAEKAEMCEQESELLRQKADERTAECHRMRIAATKVEDEKVIMEKRAQQAEILVEQVFDEFKTRTLEVQHLREELDKKTELAERLAKEKFMQSIYQPTTALDLSSMPVDMNSMRHMMAMNPALYDARIDDIDLHVPVGDGVRGHTDLEDLECMAETLASDRMRYWEKSKHLHDNLKELKNEIEVMKVQEKETLLDRLHEENLQNGDNKFTTLQKIKSGTTRARVAFFEEL